VRKSTSRDNGQAAVDTVSTSMRVDRRPYDLVLMDMQMPVLDGYSATRILRESGFTGPVLAVTAHALAGDREQLHLSGCDDYCPKPASARAARRQCAASWIQKSVRAPLLGREARAKSRTSRTRAQ
jgi:CheY-like chemotaxis protein